MNNHLKNNNKTENKPSGLAVQAIVYSVFASSFMAATVSQAANDIPDPVRPMTIHKELIEKYPAYAAKLRELKVDFLRPSHVEANSWARDKKMANSIEYRIGACSGLANDWQRQIMNSFPEDDGSMKYSRWFPGTPSSPDTPDTVAATIPGRNKFLITASGFKNDIYDTTYISLTCNN